MLKGTCVHPQLLSALALCGHGDKVLIADGNYPLDAKTGQAEKIYLGLSPGLPTVTDVLNAILGSVNVERCQVMDPGDGSTPEIFGEFSRLLPGLRLERLDRAAFYDTCALPELRVAVSTGESRTFANLLLTVGVV